MHFGIKVKPCKWKGSQFSFVKSQCEDQRKINGELQSHQVAGNIGLYSEEVIFLGTFIKDGENRCGQDCRVFSLYNT